VDYQFTHQDEVQVISLFRIISDLDNRAILDEINRSLQNGCRSVVVDLSSLEYMDSTGLNLLLVLWRHVRHFGVPLRLTEPQPAVKRLLEVTRLLPIFDFVPSVDAVLVERN